MPKKLIEICIVVAIIGILIAIGEPLFGKHPGYSRACVNGVSYLQFPNGSTTVEFTKDGTIKTCNE